MLARVTLTLQLFASLDFLHLHPALVWIQITVKLLQECFRWLSHKYTGPQKYRFSPIGLVSEQELNDDCEKIAILT